MKQLKSELADLNEEIGTRIKHRDSSETEARKSQEKSKSSPDGGLKSTYMQVTWPNIHAPHIVGLQVVRVIEDAEKGKMEKKIMKMDNTEVHQRLKSAGII